MRVGRPISTSLANLSRARPDRTTPSPVASVSKAESHEQDGGTPRSGLAPPPGRRASASRAGGCRARISFVAGQPRRQYLELYQRIHVALDMVPFNGQT